MKFGSAFIVCACAITLAFAFKDDRCPEYSEGNSATHVPHDKDCTLFYKCTPDRELVLFTCEPGLYFNPILMLCDWSNEPCNTEMGLFDETTEEPETTDEIPETTTQVMPDGECPGPEEEDPANPVHLPHPSDCSKFFKCLGGKPHLLDCPEGLHWCVACNYCDYPANANCTVSAI